MVHLLLWTEWERLFSPWQMPGISEIKDLMGMTCKEIGLGSSQSNLVADLGVLLALGLFKSVRTVLYVCIAKLTGSLHGKPAPVFKGLKPTRIPGLRGCGGTSYLNYESSWSVVWQLQLPDWKAAEVWSIVLPGLGRFCTSAIPEAYVVHHWPLPESSPLLLRTLVCFLIGVHILRCWKESPLWPVGMTNDGGLGKSTSTCLIGMPSGERWWNSLRNEIWEIVNQIRASQVL